MYTDVHVIHPLLYKYVLYILYPNKYIAHNLNINKYMWK